MIKLIAFDLDGTLTRHRTPLCEKHTEILKKLGEKYKLLMVGAGMCHRVFKQMNNFPIDIIGNYGMQVAKYNSQTKDLDIIENNVAFCDREKVAEKVKILREKYGFLEYKGDAVEFHSSGCITFPILGTKADIEDKLSFDPDRIKRRKIYSEVQSMFLEYNVFVGGSSSFDMAPKPFNKYYALDKYCKENGILHSEVYFVGDDYGLGGNDESVYKSDFNFIKVDDYVDFPKCVEFLLQ